MKNKKGVGYLQHNPTKKRNVDRPFAEAKRGGGNLFLITI